MQCARPRTSILGVACRVVAVEVGCRIRHPLVGRRRGLASASSSGQGPRRLIVPAKRGGGIPGRPWARRGRPGRPRMRDLCLPPSLRRHRTPGAAKVPPRVFCSQLPQSQFDVRRGECRLAATPLRCLPCPGGGRVRELGCGNQSALAFRSGAAIRIEFASEGPPRGPIGRSYEQHVRQLGKGLRQNNLWHWGFWLI